MLAGSASADPIAQKVYDDVKAVRRVATAAGRAWLTAAVRALSEIAVVSARKTRLQQLSNLVDGLVHLDEAQTSRLDERIATLEADLRQLIEARADRAQTSAS